jgi:hypothetical protein
VWNSVGEFSVYSFELITLPSKRGPANAFKKDTSALPYSELENNIPNNP